MAHRTHRYAVTAAAVATLAAGSIVTAAPAQALNGPIQYFTATATQLTAANMYANGPLGPIFMFPVSISRVVDGTEQVVASGRGVATYQCNGTAVNTYTAIGRELTVACG